MSLIGQLFTGLSLGSILLLAALGLSLTFGQMGVINMAHGEFIMAGCYTAYVVQQVVSTRRCLAARSRCSSASSSAALMGVAAGGDADPADVPPARWTRCWSPSVSD